MASEQIFTLRDRAIIAAPGCTFSPGNLTTLEQGLISLCRGEQPAHERNAPLTIDSRAISLPAKMNL
ncbi:hypothetical protein CGQ24_09940 [Arthrobacter sp. 7749]|nr:hypothetical protein CGQ24_09940 [Arthrobacter sp. 7749]